MRPSTQWVALGIATVLTLAGSSATAIVIRHDRDDARYVEAAERFPEVAIVRPDGTGVLVAPNWVLTAAHVARSAASRSPRVEIESQSYEVVRVLIHPEWREMAAHDVGLLELARPVEGVKPVALYDRDDEQGQVVTFVGAGDTGTGLTGPSSADGKRRAATNVVDFVDPDWLFLVFDQGDQATDLEGVSGPGDSGGPALVVRDGRKYTLGVSVFGDGQGKGPGRYGTREGYARVSTHRAWIEAVLAGKSNEASIPVGEK